MRYFKQIDTLSRQETQLTSEKFMKTDGRSFLGHSEVHEEGSFRELLRWESRSSQGGTTDAAHSPQNQLGIRRLSKIS